MRFETKFDEVQSKKCTRIDNLLDGLLHGLFLRLGVVKKLFGALDKNCRFGFRLGGLELMRVDSNLDVFALADVRKHLTRGAEAIDDAGVGEGSTGNFADTDVVEVELLRVLGHNHQARLGDQPWDN